MSNRISQLAIRRAWETGHFWNPLNPDGWNITEADLPKLTPEHPAVVQALRSMAMMEAVRFTKLHLDAHGTTPDFTGEIGPAMEKLVESGRCPVPDFAPPPGVSFHFEDPNLQQVVQRMQDNLAEPALGTGNWASCHNVGNFHCCAVGLNLSGLPSFLKTVFQQVLTNVRKAYADVGLLLKFVLDGADALSGETFSGSINTDLSFVSSSSGWIGLAIVGQNEDCSSKIWCKFLSTYKGGTTDTQIIQQWTSLIKHELGHNCGRGHTTGGVMNPSIVNGLPTEWAPNDPSTSWLKQQFGGVPVPIPGGPFPPPTPTPGPPQAVIDAVQDAKIGWCIQQINELKGR